MPARDVGFEAEVCFAVDVVDLRSRRIRSNRAAILAAVLAGATNLGLERMARLYPSLATGDFDGYTEVAIAA